MGWDAKRRSFLDRLQPLRERSVEVEEGVDQILKARLRTPRARRRSGGAAARPL